VSDSNLLLSPMNGLIGKSIHEALPSEIAAKGLEVISKAIETGNLQVFEYELDLLSEKKWFELRIVNSSKDEVLAISRDITDRKIAEQEIYLKNEQLILANSDKDRFISILAHDLKGPFNSILGFLDLLTENIHKYDIYLIENQLNIINSSAQRVYNLLEDILIWARSQSGKIPFKPQKIYFADVYNEMHEILKPAANAKSITIQPKIENDIVIFADSNMIKTILRNLISNAIKFTNNGGHIDISALKTSSNITISVADNGIGITPNALSKFFDISQTITTSGTSNETGTGLGLFICKEFVEKHGGKIWVESAPGNGSVFYFTIPDSDELEGRT